MLLEKVKDISKVNLGQNQVLLKLYKKAKKESSIIIAGNDTDKHDTGEIIKTEVILSSYDNIKVGDIIVDYRYNPAVNPPVKLNDSYYVMIPSFDVKAWTSPDNYDENIEIVEEKKESLIKEAAQGISDSDLRKMQYEAKGLNSKYLNNK